MNLELSLKPLQLVTHSAQIPGQSFSSQNPQKLLPGICSDVLEFVLVEHQNLPSGSKSWVQLLNIFPPILKGKTQWTIFPVPSSITRQLQSSLSEIAQWGISPFKVAYQLLSVLIRNFVDPVMFDFGLLSRQNYSYMNSLQFWWPMSTEMKTLLPSR